MLFRTIAGLSLLGSAVLFALRDMALWMLPVLFVGLYLGLCLLALAFLCIVCALVDLDKPQGPDDPFYRRGLTTLSAHLLARRGSHNQNG